MSAVTVLLCLLLSVLSAVSCLFHPDIIVLYRPGQHFVQTLLGDRRGFYQGSATMELFIQAVLTEILAFLMYPQYKAIGLIYK